MSRNKVKIICNIATGSLSYQFQNEQMVWMPVSQFSELSQKRYTSTSIQKSAPAILNIIKNTYNPGNRGVDITFEGTDKDYAYLCAVVDTQFSAENIHCGHRRAKVAVAGRRGVGKTKLIEALGQKQGIRYTVSAEPQYQQYKSASGMSTIEWYEVKGIDLGIGTVAEAEATIDRLIEQELTALIYCFGSNRAEDSEVQLIQNIRRRYPEVTVVGVLTNAIFEDATVSAEIMSRMLNIRVLPILAMDQKSRSGVIKAFGHERVLQAVFGGGIG